MSKTKQYTEEEYEKLELASLIGDYNKQWYREQSEETILRMELIELEKTLDCEISKYDYERVLNDNELNNE